MGRKVWKVTHEEAVGIFDDRLEMVSCQEGIHDVFDDLKLMISEWNEHQGFWTSENVGEKLMLMVTELAEAMEGHRKSAMSDKIPEYSAVEEELADTLIRIFDFAGHFNLRLAEAFLAKLDYNLTRPFKHGKSC